MICGTTQTRSTKQTAEMTVGGAWRGSGLSGRSVSLVYLVPDRERPDSPSRGIDGIEYFAARGGLTFVMLKSCITTIA
jgi:hypothetical protein